MAETITSLYGPALATEDKLNVVVAGSDDVYAGDDLVVLPGSIIKGDIDLDEKADMYFTDGPVQARQEIECRFNFWLGEYFLDTRQGIPYRRDVLVKNPNKEAIRSVFARTITSVPGLIEPRVEYTLDTKTRKLTIEWDAKWIDGQPLAPIGPKTLDVNIG
jgi:hypothetical protein